MRQERLFKGMLADLAATVEVLAEERSRSWGDPVFFVEDPNANPVIVLIRAFPSYADQARAMVDPFTGRIIGHGPFQGKITALKRGDGKTQLTLETADPPDLDGEVAIVWWSWLLHELEQLGWLAGSDERGQGTTELPQEAQESDREIKAAPQEPADVGPATSETPESPWLRIPAGQDRDIARLWNEGKSAKDIGGIVSVSADGIYNILTRVRREYGDDVAPLRNPKVAKFMRSREKNE